MWERVSTRSVKGLGWMEPPEPNVHMGSRQCKLVTGQATHWAAVVGPASAHRSYACGRRNILHRHHQHCSCCATHNHVG